MTTYDGLLMRDNLADNGVVPSPGYPYHSPDIIAHSQVEKPDTFLKLTMIQTLMRPLNLGAGLTESTFEPKISAPLPKRGGTSAYTGPRLLCLPTLTYGKPVH